MEIVFTNEETNLQYAFPLDENLILILKGTVKPTTDINPKTLEFVRGWDELSSKLKIVASIAGTTLDYTTASFLQIVSYLDKKGAIILNKKYSNKEKFLKTFKRYLKTFLVRELKNKYTIPPDIMITTLGYIHFSKHDQLNIELPTAHLDMFLNIMNSPEDLDKELKQIEEKENKLQS